MRTTVVIDDDLMAQTMQASGAQTKHEAVELGLRTLVRLSRQEKLRSLRGKFDWGAILILCELAITAAFLFDPKMKNFSF